MIRSSRMSVLSIESVGMKKDRIKNVLIRKDTTSAATTMMTASRANTARVRPSERWRSATSFDLVHAQNRSLATDNDCQCRRRDTKKRLGFPLLANLGLLTAQ